MFLKSIDIAGFKSFAKPVRLELTPGITALVGSNGSGKSNVVDAIRWALGEQSMRDLRGQRAEDVIHAGTRRSLGVAEVTLSFESDDVRDGHPAGLAISRRLYRSGESEYLLNRRRVRLRDVQDALREIGIDGGRNVVVNQGMTDALLSASPTDRRLVLEHAAGLSGYRTRRDEARQKLVTTAENIETIEVVLAELEPRLRSLRRQVKAVEDREEAAARLRIQLVAWYGWRWQQSTLSTSRLIDQAAEARAARELAEARLRDLEAKSEQAAGEERAWRARAETLTAGVHGAQREADAAGFRLRTAEQRVRSIEEQLKESQQRVHAVEQSLLGNEARARSAAEIQQELEATALEAGKELEQALAVLNADANALTTLKAVADDYRRRSLAAERKKTTLDEQSVVLERKVSDRSERLVEVSARLDESEAAEHSLETELKNVEIQVNLAIERHSHLQDAHVSARTELQATSDRRDRAERLRGRVRAESAELERQSVLNSRTVASLQGEVGSVVDGLSVVEGWEQATAAALGVWASHAKLRPSDEKWMNTDREKLLEWRAGLDIAPGIWADTQITGMRADVIDPLIATVLVSERDNPSQIWERLSGEPACLVGSPPLQIVNRHGVVVCALGEETHRQSGRTAQFLEAKRTASVLGRRQSELLRRLTTIERVRDAAAQKTDERHSIVQALTGDLISASERRNQFAAQCDHLRLRLSHIHADREKWLVARASLLEERERLLGELKDVQSRRQCSAVELSTLRDRSSQADEELRVGNEVVQTATRNVAEVRHRTDLLLSRVAAQRDLAAEIQQEVGRLRTEERTVSERVGRLQRDLQNARTEVDQLLAVAQELGTVLVEQRHALDEVKRSAPPPTPDMRSLEEPRRLLTQAVARQESAVAELRQAQTQHQQLAHEIERELDILPATLPTEIVSPPGEDELRRLRQRANQYAEASDSVIQECAELETRFQSLKSHLQDLTAASEELHGIMTLADNEMRTRFEAAFAEVNREFGRVFEVMLRGGYAQLEEEGPDCGIGIRAQLPGKRAHASAAFSGGERALVASSLLFGILKMRPTPFCVLDEVDAALDEGNVDRYLEALRDISARTQVVVVTHNRATMAASSVLYGVTMDNEGVSSLLSLRLDAITAAV